MRAGTNGQQTRKHNRRTVLRLVLWRGPISRRRICDMSGLHPATVSGLVTELINEGFLCEVGVTPARSREGGHPQVLLDLRQNNAHVIGLHIGIESIVASIGDLRGGVTAVHEAERPRTPKAAARAAARLARQAQRAAGVHTKQPLGVGAAILGVVDPDHGRVLESPDLDWHEVPIAKLLAEELGAPVAVEGSRRAMVLAELLFGRAQHERSALLVYLATSVGSGLLLEDRLVYGGSFGATALGHLTARPDGPLCACGARGCLDTVASHRALAARAARTYGWPWSAEESDGQFVSATSAICRKLFELAVAGDEAARAIVEDAGRALGDVLAQATLLLDCKLIIIAGSIQQTGELLLDPIREVLSRRCRPVLGHEPEVSLSRLGQNLLSVAPVALALERYLYGATSTVGIASAAPQPLNPDK